MKPYRFPLESILELRRSEEEAARLALTEALTSQSRAKARWDAAEAKLLELANHVVDLARSGISAGARIREWEVQKVQQACCIEVRKTFEESNTLVETRRSAAIQARRNRELLERLKERRVAEANAVRSREEQNQFDELATVRAHRANSDKIK